MVAIPLQSAALRRDGVACFGSADADHTDLRKVFKRALVLNPCTIRELPDAYAVVPATPVVNHGAIPGRAGRDNGNHDPAWHEQHASIGDDAVLGAFAILEKVRRVRQHQAHTPFGDADALKGAADEFGLGQVCAGDGCPFGADLHTIEPGIWDIQTGNKQVTLPCWSGQAHYVVFPSGNDKRERTMRAANAGGVRTKAELARLAKVPCGMFLRYSFASNQ